MHKLFTHYVFSARTECRLNAALGRHSQARLQATHQVHDGDEMQITRDWKQSFGAAFAQDCELSSVNQQTLTELVQDAEDMCV